MLEIPGERPPEGRRSHVIKHRLVSLVSVSAHVGLPVYLYSMYTFHDDIDTARRSHFDAVL
jgi:hypothetical protein